MARLLIATSVLLITPGAVAQGTIHFANASTTAGWATQIDRNVKFDGSLRHYYADIIPGANVSSNYSGHDFSTLAATLYWAPAGTTDLSLYTQALGATTTFRASTSATAGSWFPTTATLGVAGDGIDRGGTAALFVVVWDTRYSSDPLSAAATLAPLWGHSEIFSYVVPTGDTPSPAEFLPNNLTGFSLYWVPEPSSAALTGLAAASLLLIRRRK